MKVNSRKPHCITCIKTVSGTASIDEFSKCMVKRKVMMLMLIIWPKTRIEAAMPDACPYWGCFTELMMVFILGEEKSAKPIPTHTRMAMIHPMEVEGVSNASMARPDEQMAMPTVAK